MSIVERALQKAQAKAKAEAAAPLTETAEARPVAPPAPPASSPVEREPAPVHAAADESPEDSLSLTSRDLKAIVQLDFDKLREAGRVASQEMAPQVEDEIRRIKWPLLKAIEGSEGVTPARNNLVLVTSALPGEGKTFTSLNLALSIVRDREMRVVLVDGDVARPGLTTRDSRGRVQGPPLRTPCARAAPRSTP